MTQSTIARYGYVARETGSEFRSPAAHQLPAKFQFSEFLEVPNYEKKLFPVKEAVEEAEQERQREGYQGHDDNSKAG